MNLGSEQEGRRSVGAASRAQLVELIRHTRDCCVECSDKGAPLVVGIDF